MEGADDSVQLFVGCRGERVGRPRVLGWQGVRLSKVGRVGACAATGGDNHVGQGGAMGGARTEADARAAGCDDV